MEVSFCLQKLLGVDCNIVHVSSGAEMTCKARQIIDHFRSHGTPIMIGKETIALLLFLHYLVIIIFYLAINLQT